MKYFLKIALLVFGSSNINAQTEILSINGIELEVSFVKGDKDSIQVQAKITNNSKKRVFISQGGILGGFFSIGNMLYLNFGASLPSIQHLVLPFSGHLTLFELPPGASFKYTPISIPFKEIKDHVRLGLDFIVLAKKYRKKSKITISSNEYYERMSFGFSVISI